MQASRLPRIGKAAPRPDIPAEEYGPNILDDIQICLDIIGTVPVPGMPADLANTVISLARGDWLGAGLNALGIIPFFGDAAKVMLKGSALAGMAGTVYIVSRRADTVRDAVRAGDEVAAVARGPKYHSIYSDGTRVIEGQQPARFRDYLPDAEATGAHSRVRFDTVNGRVYQFREFDDAGNPLRDIDFTNPTYPNGTPRPGHPGPPHQHPIVPNDPNVGPRSGWSRMPSEPLL